jgi:hypothetical protein
LFVASRPLPLVGLCRLVEPIPLIRFIFRFFSDVGENADCLRRNQHSPNETSELQWT